MTIKPVSEAKILHKPEFQKTRFRALLMLAFFVYVYYFTFISSDLDRSIWVLSAPSIFLLVILYLDWVTTDMYRRGVDAIGDYTSIISVSARRARITEFFIRYFFIRKKFPVKYQINSDPISLSAVFVSVTIWFICIAAFTLIFQQLF